MITFFKNTLYARDYRKKASKQCSKSSGKLALIYLCYILVVMIVFIVCCARIGGSFVEIEVDGIMKYKLENFSIYFVPNIFYDLFLLCLMPVNFSFVYIAKKVYNQETILFKDIFFGYTKIIRFILLYLLQMIYIFLWSLLLVIPGIIKTFSYAMCPYIAVDNPELSVNECITKSKKMMSGYKWSYFCMLFSYLGWILLSIFTFGILLFWVMPRIQQASYLFYLKVSKKGLEIEMAKAEENNL